LRVSSSLFFLFFDVILLVGIVLSGLDMLMLRYSYTASVELRTSKKKDKEGSLLVLISIYHFELRDETELICSVALEVPTSSSSIWTKNNCWLFDREAAIDP